MPTIFEPRERLTPYEYPECYEAWLKARQSSWIHTEVAMDSDVQDWGNCDETAKAVIAGILRGFTLQEQRIGCYWRDVVARNFPKPEIQFMAAEFSAQEAIHAYAYNYLESSLSLDTYEAFMADETAQAKLALYSNEQISGIGLSLATFSAAGEGISLFGSFALLLSYCRTGKFKGLKQILSWSVRDEQQHNDMGCYLYSKLPAELKPTQAEVEAMLAVAIENEMAFISGAMQLNSSIDLSEVKAFLNNRARIMLGNMGYSTSRFVPAQESISDWF